MTAVFASANTPQVAARRIRELEAAATKWTAYESSVPTIDELLELREEYESLKAAMEEAEAAFKIAAVRRGVIFGHRSVSEALELKRNSVAAWKRYYGPGLDDFSREREDNEARRAEWRIKLEEDPEVARAFDAVEL